MAYEIDYCNGRKIETGDIPLDEVKHIADANAGYTQLPIVILDVAGECEVTRRTWFGTPCYDDDFDPDVDIISYGRYGYYSEWEGGWDI